MPTTNAQGLLRAYLEDGTGVPWYVSEPTPRPARDVPYGVVRRINGQRENALVDNPRISVIAHAGTEQAAYELSDSADDLVYALPRDHFADGFDSVTPIDRRSEPDPDTSLPRWVATYSMKTHRY